MTARRFLLIATALAATASPTSARAQSQPPIQFPAIPVSAKTGSGAFSGRLVLDPFVVRGSFLRVQGRMTGTLRDRRYPGPQPIDQDFAFTAGNITPGGCAQLRFTVVGRTVRLFGLRAVFPQRTYTVRPRGARAAALREILCALPDVAAATMPPPPAPLPGQPAPAPTPPSVPFVHLLNALRLTAR